MNTNNMATAVRCCVRRVVRLPHPPALFRHSSSKVTTAASLTPEEVLVALDKHIVGQRDAKVATAIALRDQWRRQQLDADFQRETLPNNILMIGPTGVGKTEIARRLARLAHAPFVNVEATKFTEVGIYGQDTDSMIQDLVDAAAQQVEEMALEAERPAARERAIDTIVSAIGRKTDSGRENLKEKIRNGLLDDKLVDLDLPPRRRGGLGGGMLGGPLGSLIGGLGGLGGGGGGGGSGRMPHAGVISIGMPKEIADQIGKGEAKGGGSGRHGSDSNPLADLFAAMEASSGGAHAAGEDQEDGAGPREQVRVGEALLRCEAMSEPETSKMRRHAMCMCPVHVHAHGPCMCMRHAHDQRLAGWRRVS